MTRSDVRTEVRDYLWESSAGTLITGTFTDEMLNRFFLRELRSLPSKGIYKEEKWDLTLSENVQEYTLPDNTFKLEKVERQDGTSDAPNWNEITGWDTYGNTVKFEFLPYINLSLRGLLKMKFTDVEDDVTDLDIDDDKSEALIVGIVIRCYKALMAYYRQNLSWDGVTKPGDISLSAIQAWLRDAKQDQKEIIKMYATSALPKDINLTS